MTLKEIFKVIELANLNLRISSVRQTILKTKSEEINEQSRLRGSWGPTETPHPPKADWSARQANQLSNASDFESTPEHVLKQS